MNAAEIAAALGGRRSGAWWRALCLLHGGNSETLAFRDGERGLILKCFRGCHRDDILADLRQQGLIYGGAKSSDTRPDPAEMARRREVEARERQRKIALAGDIWRSSYPARGTLVETYLRSRGIMLPVPPVIRLVAMHGSYGRHPSGSRRSQMVALVEHAEHGLVAVHRTYLAVDGSSKANVDPVRTCHGPIGGAAVRLAPATETLMVGEGIETCLSVMQATSLPAWAALSAGGIEALALPPVVRNVLIVADNDVNGTGERAAHAAANRWVAEGRRVRIAMPPVPGTDFNDVLMGRRHTEVRDVAA